MKKLVACFLVTIHVVRKQYFPKNQHFLPSDTHINVLVLEKFCVRTKWMIPYIFVLIYTVFRKSPGKIPIFITFF